MKERMKRRLLLLLLAVGMICSLTIDIPVTVLGADQDVVVLYTNNVHCGVDNSIGYAGLSLCKKQMQQQIPYVTLVDVGDTIQGAPIGMLSEGGYLIDVMSQVGYDMVVPDNRGFDYGMVRFLDLAGELNCDYYSCNFTSTATGAAVFTPYRVITYRDTRVAYVGVSTPKSFTKSAPAYFQDEAGSYIYSFCEDGSGQSLYSQIQTSVDAARNEGADYVIMVGHLGEIGVTDRWSAVNIIGNTTGINVYIDGHSHETTPNMTTKNRGGQDIIITQTGTKLNDIRKLTIGTDGTIRIGSVSEVLAMDLTRNYVVRKNNTLSRITRRELGSYDRWIDIYNHNLDKLKNADLLPVGLHLLIPGGSIINENGKAMDYATNRLIKGIQSQCNETLKTVFGTTPHPLTVNDPTDGNRRVRSGETSLGGLTADVYRTQLGADIGLSSGGGVRADIKPENITYSDTLAVSPYGNMGCVVEAIGQVIKNVLEMTSKGYPQEYGGFLQMSGLTHTIDSSVNSSMKLSEKRNPISVNGPYGVKDIMANGEPVDLSRTYTVASHNYMLKSKGDSMTMFSGCNAIRDKVMVDVDVLSSYIRSLDGAVTAEYADPLGQGRVRIQ